MRARFPYPWWYNAFVRITYSIEVCKITYRIQTTTRLWECPRAQVVETTYIFGWFNFSKYDVLHFKEKDFVLCMCWTSKCSTMFQNPKHILYNCRKHQQSRFMMSGQEKNIPSFDVLKKYISNRSKHHLLIKGELEMNLAWLQLCSFQQRNVS